MKIMAPFLESAMREKMEVSDPVERNQGRLPGGNDG
jgi:hypothetical protein